jgi:uncharacterized protein YndB with AHSA1/START domain
VPRVSRSRTIGASPREVWALVSDPYGLPRWWPRTIRVENVDRKEGGRRSRWTKVLETASGRPVRADYTCLSAAEGKRYVWQQDVAGTPFERHLRSSELEIELEPESDGTKVTLTSNQTLRGLSRLGSPMMRGASRKMLDDALGGIERALVPEGEAAG